MVWPLAQWSDRPIALLCGLTAKTEARIQLERAGECTEMAEQTVRAGIDGRVRPARRSESRERVLRALEQNPHGSSRCIASIAAVAPETVTNVRRALQEKSGHELGLASDDHTVSAVLVFDHDMGEGPVCAVGYQCRPTRSPLRGSRTWHWRPALR